MLQTLFGYFNALETHGDQFYILAVGNFSRILIFIFITFSEKETGLD